MQNYNQGVNNNKSLLQDQNDFEQNARMSLQDEEAAMEAIEEISDDDARLVLIPRITVIKFYLILKTTHFYSVKKLPMLFRM